MKGTQPSLRRRLKTVASPRKALPQKS